MFLNNHKKKCFICSEFKQTYSQNHTQYKEWREGGWGIGGMGVRKNEKSHVM